MHGYLNVIFAHIQSYFLVFRKNIIQKKLLVEYFKEQIDGETTSINTVYCQFESGLFDYLSRQKQMTYSTYAGESNLDIYYSTYVCITKYNLPIVKKKGFAETEKYIDNIKSTLSYIKYETEYDVNLILDSVRRVYGVDIQPEDIQPIDGVPLVELVHAPKPLVTEADVEWFIGEDKFYIYGAGVYAFKTYWRFAKENDNFLGFIISDGEKSNRIKLFNKKIYRFSEIKDIYEKKVILGVGKENAQEILKRFQHTEKVPRLF